MAVVLDRGNVNQRRGAIEKRLKVLLERSCNCQYQPTGTDLLFVLGDGKPTPPLCINRIHGRNTFVTYFEIWKPLSKEKFYLSKMYLHVAHSVSAERGLEQVIALHCEPETSDGTPSEKYKCSPHLHIVQGEHWFRRAHISLFLPDPMKAIASIADLDLAFSSAIEFIRLEILPLVPR